MSLLTNTRLSLLEQNVVELEKRIKRLEAYHLIYDILGSATLRDLDYLAKAAKKEFLEDLNEEE